MFRGTTPTLYFKINNIEDLSKIKDIWVTLVSGANPPYHMPKNSKELNITKTLLKEEVKLNQEDKVVSVTLTQKETLNCAQNVKAQLKIIFEDELIEEGIVCASPIFNIPVEGVLNQQIMKLEEEVVEEPEIPTEENPEPTPEGGEPSEEQQGG